MADDKTELPEGTDTVDRRRISTENVSDGTICIVARAAPLATRLLEQGPRAAATRLSGQAADKARGLVGQGLERSAKRSPMSRKLVGDTAAGLDERLGEEYGDYARRPPARSRTPPNSLAAKDPDELIDDTRDFVRKSPGVALAGAAIVGFALARLIKSGLASQTTTDERQEADAEAAGRARCGRRRRRAADRRAVRPADRRRQGLCQGRVRARVKADGRRQRRRRSRCRPFARRRALLLLRPRSTSLASPFLGAGAADRPVRAAA